MLNLSFKGKNFKIVNKFYIFLAISLAVILAGVATIIFKGLNVGIDFSAGATIEVTLPGDVSGFDQNAFTEKYENWLKGDRDNDGTAENARVFAVSNTRVSNTSGETTFEFRIGSTVKENGEEKDLSVIEKDESSEYYNKKLLVAYVDDIKNEIKDDIKAYLKTAYASTFDEMSDDDFDKTVSLYTHTIDNSIMLYTIKTAFIAAAVAIVVMLIYIMFRFTWVSGIAAVLALVHDVLVMVAFTAFFQIPVNSVFIAAVITIIGYSINATIIIFDKIREYMNTPSFDGTSDTDLANVAVTNTLTRSILTTLTTLVVIVLLAVFAPATIREFAYPIIFGLFAGAYSSVLLSASIWVNLRKLFKQSGSRPKRKISKKRATEIQG